MDEIINRYRFGRFNAAELLSTDSTNEYLKRRAREGKANDGDAALALYQSAGKGRLGRSFFSPSDSGLYMSVFLKRKITPELSKFVTPAAAVAVALALEECGSEHAGIKWVNDIYISGKKVCGILTESKISSENMLDYLIIGIGVNIFPPEGGFPDDIKDKAGAAFPKKIPGMRIKLAEKILLNLDGIENSVKTRSFLDGYISRSILTGKKVYITYGGAKTEAEVIGIDGECRLVVKTADGVLSLNSGEATMN